MAKARRTPGSGQIIERIPGKRYLVRVFLGRDADGRKRYHNLRVDGSRKDAEAVLRERLAARDRGAYVRPTQETVAAYLRRWLAQKDWRSARTRQDYTAVVERYLVPALGPLKLAALRPADIKGLYATLRGQGLTRRLLYCHQVLRAALREAERMGDLATNPIRAVQTPHVPRRAAGAQDAPARALSAAEARRLLAVAQQADGCIGPLVALLLDAGLRPSEALALQWSDLTADCGQVTVQRAVEQVDRRPRLKPTLKTAAARRVIPLAPATAALLRAHRARQLAQRLRAGARWVDHDLVFANSRGGLLDLDNLTRRHFKPLLRQAGLDPRHRLYDLRHTCATLALAAGVPVRTVAARLGHANVSMTLNVYAHSLAEHQEAARDALAGILWAAEG